MNSFIPNNILIDCINVSKTFINGNKSDIIFSDFNLQIEISKVTCILGPSGCGKTTLFNIISRLDSQHQGSVKYKNNYIQKSYLFQEDLLLPWLTAYQNAFLGIRFSQKRDNLEENIHRLFKVFGLEEFKNYFPSQLSGGMKQRVSLIRTLSAKPELIFFDEPFTALDFNHKLSIEKMIIKEKNELNQSLVFITHNIEEAIALGDRLVVLSGKPAKIIYDSQIIFNSDKAGRDPVKVRQDPKFSQYFKSIYHVFENEE
ncbi:MAG: ATP-binding cassette domain-containing protein [Bacteroidales bacterium]|nr:ATP-binding cassette domain-containing protein [Bacteroidales bacterium]